MGYIVEISEDGHDECMEEYIIVNGWHFNEKLCEWAVGTMLRHNPSTGNEEPVAYTGKEIVDNMLSKHGVTLRNNTGHDYVYVANMARADFGKSSIEDDAHMALFVKDMIDDPDQKEGYILNRFVADCRHNGKKIPWRDVL